jgi:hypothetical protein
MSFESKYKKYKQKYLDLKNVTQDGGEEEFLSYSGKTVDGNGPIIKNYFEGRYINEKGKSFKAKIYQLRTGSQPFRLAIRRIKDLGSKIMNLFDETGSLEITEEDFQDFATKICNRGANWEIKYTGPPILKFRSKEFEYKTDEIIKLPGIWVWNDRRFF